MNNLEKIKNLHKQATYREIKKVGNIVLINLEYYTDWVTMENTGWVENFQLTEFEYMQLDLLLKLESEYYHSKKITKI